MAKQTNTGVDLYPTRYSERRLPQFVGGEVDTASGNIIPGTAQDAAQGKRPTASSTGSALNPLTRTGEGGESYKFGAGTSTPEPEQPRTRLASVSVGDLPRLDVAQVPTPQAPKASFGDQLLNAGLSLGTSLASAGLKNAFFPQESYASQRPSAAPPSTGSDFFIPGVSQSDLDVTSRWPSNQDIFPTGAGSAAPVTMYDDPWSAKPASSDLGATAAFTQPPAPAYTPPPEPTPPAPQYHAAPRDGGFEAGVSGGTVICTELHRQGLLDGITFEADQAFGSLVASRHPEVYSGYLLWAQPCVALMQRSVRFTRFVTFFATPWAQYLAVRMKQRRAAPLRGAIAFHVGWAVCKCLGRARRAWQRLHLNGAPRTAD